MSILSRIFNKIFPPAQADTPSISTQSPTQTSAQPPPTPNANNMTPAQSPNGSVPPNSAISELDVEKILSELVKKSGQPLNWRTSIVDLLKLLDIDSSIQARKELAQELNYTGDTNDSAKMNIWLHRQVMNKLAANGGKVPAELKD